jgi:hypothetical protein
MKKFNYMILIMMFMFMFSIGNVFANTTNVGTATGLVNDGQAQGQGQGQGQTIDDHSTTISERAFPNQGGVGYGAMPGYFGDNNKPGHQFISLDKLMMYNTTWLIKDETPTGRGQNLNIIQHVDKVEKEDRSKSVVCTKRMFDKEKVEVKLLAVGTMNATNKKTISAKLLEYVLKEASLYGATHIQFLGEGTNTELSSGGWGIGLAYTKASDTAVSTGGTGFSTGWAGYNNLPWQQFFFLKVVDPAAVAEVDSKMTDGNEVDSTTVVDAQVDKAVKSAVTQ